MNAFLGRAKLFNPSLSMTLSNEKDHQCWGAKKKKEPSDLTVEVMLKLGDRNLFISPIVCLHDVVTFEGQIVVDTLYSRRNEIITELQGTAGMYASKDIAMNEVCNSLINMLTSVFIGKRGRPKWSKPGDYYVYLSSISNSLCRNGIVKSKGTQVMLGKTEAYAITLSITLSNGEQIDVVPFIGYKNATNPQVDPKKIYECLYATLLTLDKPGQFKNEVINVIMNRLL